MLAVLIAIVSTHGPLSGGAHGAESSETHSGGESGHAGGGGTHGGGSHSGGGHGEESGEATGHGTKPDHSGHASGVHDGGMEGQDHGSGTGASGRGKGYATNRLFGGGTGALGSGQVPEGLPTQSQSQGTGPLARNRLRYWGGRSIPELEPEEIVPGGGGGTAVDVSPFDQSRCEDFGPERLEPFSSANLERLRSAYDTLTSGDPRPSPDEHQRALIQLAVYQFEVLSRPTDFSLAGTFLGSVAQVPVTEELVDKVNRKLCVDPSWARSSMISNVAEAERSRRASAGAPHR